MLKFLGSPELLFQRGAVVLKIGENFNFRNEIMKICILRKNVDIERMKTMSKNIKVKLNEEEKIIIEGNITEYECACALRDMNNNKSPGSDGITTEFFKIF